MRAPCGCPIDVDGPVLHGSDGPCLMEPPSQPPPTAEDYCAADGHPYYGDDGDGSEGTMGRCYCGAQVYPVGGGKDAR